MVKCKKIFLKQGSFKLKYYPELDSYLHVFKEEEEKVLPMIIDFKSGKDATYNQSSAPILWKKKIKIREPTLKRCPLTATHGSWLACVVLHMCAHTQNKYFNGEQLGSVSNISANQQ